MNKLQLFSLLKKVNPWWWTVASMCAFKRIEKLWPKLSRPALLGLDIWVARKWSDVATDILSRHTPPHLKQLHGLKKRSAPDCSDYATSSTMATCRVVTPPILLACPITLIIGTLPQISTTPLIRGDGYHGMPSPLLSPIFCFRASLSLFSSLSSDLWAEAN